MKKQILLVAIFGLTFFGCSNAPEPIKLDGGSATTINQNLITQKLNEIEQDPFLKNNRWSYNIYFEKIGDELMKNDEVVKGFYLAHNADKMIIIGNEKIAKEYKDFFLANQVKAHIELHPIDMIDGSKKKVNVLFFSKKIKD